MSTTFPILPLSRGMAKDIMIKHLTDHILSSYRFFSIHVGEKDLELWRYDDTKGIWVPNATVFVEDICREVLDRYELWRPHIGVEVAKGIALQNIKRPEDLNTHIFKMVFKNGVYDFEKDTFDPNFQPDEFHTIAMPVAYDPNAICPNTDKFLGQILRQRDVLGLQEFLGQCLIKKVIYEMFFVLYGKTHSGKSILLNVLTEFFGEENVVAISPQDLSTRQFATVDLLGKLVNLRPDLPYSLIGNRLKSLGGKDRIGHDRKHTSTVYARPFAKSMFTTNIMPKTDDTSDAFFIRFRIVDTQRQFMESDPDYVPEDILIATLTTPSELSGLLNNIIEGWRRLRKNNGILTAHESNVDRKRAYMRRADPIYYVASECIIPKFNARVLKSVVYGYYVDICHEQQIAAVGDTGFSIEFEKAIKLRGDIALGDMVTRDKDKGSFRVWKGFQLAYRTSEGLLIPLTNPDGSIFGFPETPDTPQQPENPTKEEIEEEEHKQELESQRPDLIDSKEDFA